MVCSLLASLAPISTSRTDLVGESHPSHLTRLTYHHLEVPCMEAQTRTSHTRTPNNKCTNSPRPRRLSSLVRRLRMQERAARVFSRQRRTRARVRVMGRLRPVVPARVRACTTYCRSTDGNCLVECEMMNSMRIIERDA
jgi:hypothetical protein